MSELERWRNIAARHDAEAAFYALQGNPERVTKRRGPATVPAAVQTAEVTVRRGDTLQGIAKRYSAHTW